MYIKKLWTSVWNVILNQYYNVATIVNNVTSTFENVESTLSQKDICQVTRKKINFFVFKREAEILSPKQYFKLRVNLGLASIIRSGIVSATFQNVSKL